jgi:hypothetical protein
MIFKEFNNESSNFRPSSCVSIRKELPIRFSGLQWEEAVVQWTPPSVNVPAGLEVSIVDLDLRIPLWIGLSPPDMWACTLSSSGLAGCSKD